MIAGFGTGPQHTALLSKTVLQLTTLRLWCPKPAIHSCSWGVLTQLSMASKLNWRKAAKIKHFPICCQSSFRKIFLWAILFSLYWTYMICKVDYFSVCSVCGNHCHVLLICRYGLWAQSTSSIVFDFCEQGFPGLTITRICKRNLGGFWSLFLAVVYVYAWGTCNWTIWQLFSLERENRIQYLYSYWDMYFCHIQLYI